MNLEPIDTSTTAGKVLDQFAELLKVGGYEGELRIGRAFGEALVAEIAALTPPEGHVSRDELLSAQDAAFLDGVFKGVFIPDGYVLVPLEPTDEMIDAGRECGSKFVYQRMLAARPELP